MTSLHDELTTLRNWSTATSRQRESACLSIIRHFECSIPSAESVAVLAEALATSGSKLDWPDALRPLTDVASSGGPSSLSTLLCPYIVAAGGCFVPRVTVPGYLAGALDVLQLIDGYRTNLDHAAMLHCLESCRIFHASISPTMTPADGYLFDLRKKLGKKAIPALAVASLLAKKLVVSTQTAVVDVRCGPLGNMGITASSCSQAATLLVQTADVLGLSVSCVVTDITEPQCPFLGRSESLFALHSALSSVYSDAWLSDHVKTCVGIAGETLRLNNVETEPRLARRLARDLLRNGEALKIFHANLEAQGSSVRSLGDLLDRYVCSRQQLILAQTDGYVEHIASDSLSRVLADINRRDPSRNDILGMRCMIRKGDRIDHGEPVLELRLGEQLPSSTVDSISRQALAAVRIADYPVMKEESQLLAVIGPNGITQER